MTLLQLSFLSSLFLFPIFLQMSVLSIGLFVNVYTYSWSSYDIAECLLQKRKYPQAYFDIKHIFRNKIYNQMNQSIVNPINSSPHRPGEKRRRVKGTKKGQKKSRNKGTISETHLYFSIFIVLPQEFPTLSN